VPKGYRTRKKWRFNACFQPNASRPALYHIFTGHFYCNPSDFTFNANKPLSSFDTMNRFVPDFVHSAVDNTCPAWWKEGCGCNSCFGTCANVLEVVTPFVEQVGNCIWIFGSPLAFPLIFCFSPAPHTKESSGYEISMLEAPCRRPCTCILSTVCVPCAQWYVRRAVLGYDMSKYKLWQGYHDGPQCCARTCPSAPITIRSGTYGEQDCPYLFLALEVCCLAGMFSTCCAFDVSRRYQREERGLSTDPTEHRHHKCIDFFSHIMHTCFQLGCCMCATSCLVGVCAPDSAGAQDFAGEAGRAARACCRIAHTIWKGILWTRVIGMGCMTTQMIHEANTPWDMAVQGKKMRPECMIPQSQKMKDRGASTFNESQTQRSDRDDETPTEISAMLMPWEKPSVEAGRANQTRAQQP
jgi:hypothetical protein